MLELKTILLAMLPINELRGTIPIALSLYDFSPIKAFLLAYLGNLIPVFFLLLFWRGLAQALVRRSRVIERALNWIFARTKERIMKKHALYGNIILILFVAIPLPVTGAWTGTIAAYLLGIPYWKSVLLIAIGVLIAGAIVTLASLGIIGLF